MGGVPIWSGSGSVEGVGVAVIVRRADGRSSSLSSCAGSLVAGTSRPPELQDAYKSAGRLEGRLKFLGFQSSRRLPSTVPFSPSPVEIHRRLWSVAGGDTKLPRLHQAPHATTCTPLTAHPISLAQGSQWKTNQQGCPPPFSRPPPVRAGPFQSRDPWFQKTRPKFNIRPRTARHPERNPAWLQRLSQTPVYFLCMRLLSA